jgi:hypothetical protein
MGPGFPELSTADNLDVRDADGKPLVYAPPVKSPG